MKTVEDAWKFYQEAILSNSKKRSQVSEKGRWERHINPVLGAKNIDELTKFDYLRLRKSIENKNLSPQSVHHALSLLRRILNAITEWGVYQKNDIPNFQKILPKFDNKRQRFLTKKEADKLLFCLQDSENWQDIVKFALNTGLRRGEIFNIERSHIDINNSLLLIIDSKTKKTG